MTRPDREPAALVFNGVNGETGDYLRPPVRLDRLVPKRRRRWRQAVAGVDTRDLAQAGWGVLFAPDAEPIAREGLGRLLRHREAQAGGRGEGGRYREYVYTPGETSATFLARHGRRFGPADPEVVPYYLLIVGSPEAIPFELQYQLDIQYAVGRLWFGSAGEYEAYARCVIEAEARPAPPSREAVFFAPQHPDDPMTGLSAQQLARPLASKLAGKVSGWQTTSRAGEEADKRRLARLLGGGETPALLFTAGHGIGLPQGHAQQPELQGALLCQGWPGPLARTLADDHYFAARDVPAEASLGGLISFHFACYSAGTPRWDSFSHLETGARSALAEQSFLARLPQRLLSLSRGGALAVIGHIDQAWLCSFLWEETGAPQLQVFVSVLTELMRGSPVGAAMEYFGQRYAEIAAELSLRLEPVRGGEHADSLDLYKLWLANNDARSYVVLGDPAVRLPPPPARRPQIQSESAEVGFLRQVKQS